MAQAQSAARGQGGVNAGGFANDTIVVIKSNLEKVIKKITWSYGAGGGGSPFSNSVFGRLVVIDGVDGSAYASLTPSGVLSTGIAATAPYTNADSSPTGIGQFGGIVRFDTDLIANNTLPLGGQFDFPDDDDSGGSLICTGGSITVLLTAPRNSAGTVAQAVTGKLYVQYRELDPNQAGSKLKTYSYKPVSPPLH